MELAHSQNGVKKVHRSYDYLGMCAAPFDLQRFKFCWKGKIWKGKVYYDTLPFVGSTTYLHLPLPSGVASFCGAWGKKYKWGLWEKIFFIGRPLKTKNVFLRKWLVLQNEYSYTFSLSKTTFLQTALA